MKTHSCKCVYERHKSRHKGKHKISSIRIPRHRGNFVFSMNVEKTQAVLVNECYAPRGMNAFRAKSLNYCDWKPIAQMCYKCATNVLCSLPIFVIDILIPLVVK